MSFIFQGLSVTTTTQQHSRASFFRRLAAMVYDLLVAVAVGMCAAMIMLVTMMILVENNILSNQGYEGFSELMQHSFAYKLILQVWVGLWIVGFFLWFWRNGGQTIGMRAWRLRLFSTNEKPFGYSRALLRLVCSFGGLGTLLVLFDFKSKQSLQDRIANTEILVLSKEDNHHAAWKELQD
ncbi:RDD family protein [Paraglaciecola arctica]|uniref:RDD family protein n=1 Tax=Paraglaciecola arctica TaxID=1128911 RepID=UPI00221E781B|nr:RDD family protein [Paraglaciecola arctica]